MPCIGSDISNVFRLLAHMNDKDIVVMPFDNNEFNKIEADQLFDLILSTFKFTN